MTIKTAIWRLASWSGLPGLARLLHRRARHVLMFHGIASKHWPGVPAPPHPHLDAGDLRRILTWLAPRFDFLTPDAFLTTAKPGLLLTFDDGFANNATQALPVLAEFDAPAVFFVTTRHVRDPRDWLPATRQAVERHWPGPEPPSDEIAADVFDGMSEAHLKACASHPLITIGSHTVNHPFLTRLPPDEVAEELTASKSYLEALTGEEVALFAYPSGDYHSEILAAAERAGYAAAFAVISHRLGRLRYEVPRIGLYRAEPWYLNLKLSGLHHRSLPGRVLIP